MNDPDTTVTQYVIGIGRSLFSDLKGIVNKYVIYVRQGMKFFFKYSERVFTKWNIDMNQNDSFIRFNGTYNQARSNLSFDYLAMILSVSDLAKISKKYEHRRIFVTRNCSVLSFFVSCQK